MAKVIFKEDELLSRFPFEQPRPHVLVDVGAHIGNFARRFLADGWRVIGFEPDPENFQALVERMRGHPGSMAIPKAVSDVTERATFYRSTEHWGIHSLRPFHPTHRETIEMDVVRLDDALREHAIDRVTLLKIDAEGADFLALQSFPFDRIRPEIVMTEFMDERSRPHFGYDHHEVVAFMEERGYVAYVSEWAPVEQHSRRGGGGGPFHFLQILPHPLHHPPAWGNLVFLEDRRREAFEKTVNRYLVELDRRREEATTPARPASASARPRSLVDELRRNVRKVPGARRLWRAGRRLVGLKAGATARPRGSTTSPARPGPPAVTVVVVASGEDDARALRRTAASVQRQSLEAWEGLLVVERDAASLVAAADQLAKGDPRFRVLRHGRFGDHRAVAKNSGSREATAPLLCWLDAGDVLLSETLERGARIARRAGGLGSAFAGVRFGVVRSHEVKGGFPIPVEGADVFDPEPLPTAAAVVRRDVLVRFGGFDERLGQEAESALWQTMFRHGHQLLASGWAGVGTGPLSATGGEAALGWLRARRAPFPADRAHDGPPFLYTEPVETYRASVHEARQLLRARARGPAGSAGPAPAPEAFTSLRAAVQPELAVAYGLAEARGLDPADALDLWDEAVELCRALAATAGAGHPAPTAEAGRAPAAAEPRGARAPATSEPEPGTRPRLAASEPEARAPMVWTERAATRIQIAFAPHKDYHAWTMGRAAVALRDRGYHPVWIDSTEVTRDEGARARMAAYDVPSVSYNNYRLGAFRPPVLVVMNDWEPQIRALVEASNQDGVTTVGVVEGVQDFTDADTGRERRPYQRVRTVFLTGEFDRQFFPEEVPTRVIGVPRLDELRDEVASFPTEPLVVVNSNFSYGVLTDARDAWLASVEAACRAKGLRMVVSRHPADEGDFSRYEVTPLSMYDAIRQGSVFVSRFGSGIIEALAMGKPSVYHNPHGEKVIKFGDPLGAYSVTTDAASLAEALEREVADQSDRRPRAQAFLDHHVAWSADRPSNELFVEALAELIDAG